MKELRGRFVLKNETGLKVKEIAVEKKILIFYGIYEREAENIDLCEIYERETKH